MLYLLLRLYFFVFVNKIFCSLKKKKEKEKEKKRTPPKRSTYLLFGDINVSLSSAEQNKMLDKDTTKWPIPSIMYSNSNNENKWQNLDIVP